MAPWQALISHLWFVSLFLIIKNFLVFSGYCLTRNGNLYYIMRDRLLIMSVFRTLSNSERLSCFFLIFPAVFFILSQCLFTWTRKVVTWSSFCTGSSALRSTVGRRRIGAGSWSALPSSSTFFVTSAPKTPVSPITVHCYSTRKKGVTQLCYRLNICVYLTFRFNTAWEWSTI